MKNPQNNPSTLRAPVLRASASGSLSRRRFLKTAAVSAGALGSLPLWAAPNESRKKKKALPKPQHSGIEHVVVIMMENRSFDHFLGWLPGADGLQAGLTYADAASVGHATFPLAPDYQGCDHPDPDHSYEGGRVEYNQGACDGWLRAGENDLYAIGYYTPTDLPFYAGAAPTWTVCDRYFASIMAETFPNKIYQHAAQADRLDNTLDLSALPTIWDRLAARRIAARYYFSDVPFLALWGTKYLSITRPLSQFFADCASGNLPAVSMVDPRFLGEEIGLSNDDHPHADIRNGQVFLNAIYEAVTASPDWPHTVLVINYDEWGGFFEHVPPPLAAIPPADAALGNDGRLGFRVPCLVVSPWSPRRTVSHGIFDHTSVLRMIEWRWQLPALTIRDATANNLAETLIFDQPNLTAPRFAVPEGFFGTPCPFSPFQIAAFDKWAGLRVMADELGFPSV